MFQNARDAQAAVRDLKAAGFRDNEIGVIGPDDDDRSAGKSVDKGTHAAEGAAVGAVAGAGAGALWAVGIAAGLLPAIGPVIAGGIFASILASAAGGAAVAGLAGALIGLGIPEEEAKYYENEFRSGRTIVTVKTTTRQDEARRILGRHHSYDMESRPDRIGSSAATSSMESTRPSMHTEGCRTESGRGFGTGESAGQKVQLREEQLHTEKVQKQAGEVRVHKDVVTEHKEIQVPVTREEVVIERHAAHGARPAGDIVEGEEIRVPVKEEEVRVTKTPVAKEEVSVGKRTVQETRTVGADVKHEELRVEETGDVHVKGSERSRKAK